jgi:hypothetical protein
MYRDAYDLALYNGKGQSSLGYDDDDSYSSDDKKAAKIAEDTPN